jgi:hypothetical protein
MKLKILQKICLKVDVNGRINFEGATTLFWGYG